MHWLNVISTKYVRIVQCCRLADQEHTARRRNIGIDSVVIPGFQLTCSNSLSMYCSTIRPSGPRSDVII